MGITREQNSKWELLRAIELNEGFERQQVNHYYPVHILSPSPNRPITYENRYNSNDKPWQYQLA